MKFLKKVIALLACMILLTGALAAPALAEGDGAAYVTFSVRLHSNWISSRYGVTVYIDDTRVGHMDQGDSITFGGWLDTGRTHTLRFDPDKAGVPDRVWNLGSLQNGSVVTCEIQAKSSDVRLREYSITLGGEVLESVSPDTAAQVRIFGVILSAAVSVIRAIWTGGN